MVMRACINGVWIGYVFFGLGMILGLRAEGLTWSRRVTIASILNEGWFLQSLLLM